MHTIIRAARLGAALVLAALASAGSYAADAPSQPGFWQTPAIEGVGKMHPLPQAAYRPNKRETYKVVFSVTRGASKPGEINPGLEHVARAVNLYVSAGVPLGHLKFVAILYGPATDAALDDAHYRERFAADNPNLALIRTLRKTGVDVAVCGQAVAEHGYHYDWIAPEVTVALSALTTITVLEHQGYALMPM
ncbi:MAG TPA: DsrE family protein [Steroidobacteraceae bacterium]|nr:DsrE family protein [Steroidobacteraceae bacterium]